MSVRTRFAPSPTGSLHIGGVRTALYCLLYAHKSGGKFVLRIEDTDQARSTDEAAAGILRDLTWCGLTWDEGPGLGRDDDSSFYQSRRLPIYNGYIEQLLASGHAYYAFDSKDELDVRRKEAESQKATFRYKGAAVSAEAEAKFRAEGRVPVVRLSAPKHDVTVPDVILGDVTVVAEDLEDIVIRKADGFPTYHFAVVIDDHLMGITQVLRGQEHLLNTHKHVGLYEALGWEIPAHGHLPLIFNPAGQKMSKREKAQTAREAARKEHANRKATDYEWLAELAQQPLDEITSFMKKEHDRIGVATAIGTALNLTLPMIDVMDFRKGGYLPEALLNYMALLGWSPKNDVEIMPLADMTALFSFEGINRTAARFDPKKLAWMNGEYLKAADDARWLTALESWLEVVQSPISSLKNEQRLALVAMYRDRVNTLAELDQKASFFFVRPESYDPKAVAKWLPAEGRDVLAKARAVLAEVPWTIADIERELTAVVDGNVGAVAQPMRVAMTGTAVSPGLFETVAFLSREEVLLRIDRCLQSI